MNKVLAVIFATIVHLGVIAQDGFSLDAGTEGFFSLAEEDQLPFWMYKNQRGRVSEYSDYVGFLKGGAVFGFNSKSQITVGLTASYDNNPLAGNDIWLDEYFMKIDYGKFYVLVGRNQREKVLDGLSATNENFAWSLNSRAIPRISFGTSETIFINRESTIGFNLAYEEYFLEEDRYMVNANLHHKNFFLVFKNNRWRFKAGIEHFAQYGGKSQDGFLAANGLGNYLRVILGREGGEEAFEGEQENVVGNHLGVYVFDLKYGPRKYDFNFIYNHFFEDGSGTRFSNFPDGRYAIHIKNKDQNSFVNSYLFELYYTKNRSKNSDGPENVEQYFNNFLLYRSGWSYQKRVIGLPFFDFDQSAPRGSIINDEFVAYHFGFGGYFAPTNLRYPFKLILTNVNYSNQTRRTEKTKSNVAYTYFDLGLIQRPFDLSISFGTEFSAGDSPIFAAGLSVSKSFF